MDDVDLRAGRETLDIKVREQARSPIQPTLEVEPTLGEAPSWSVLAGRYHLKRRLGIGGLGEVFEATDRFGGQRVAVKFIRNDSIDDRARIRREVAALRLLRIPGVVQFHGEGRTAHQHFIVMECVDGEPFPGGGFDGSWESLLGPTVGLLETLGRIHSAGLIHRDIKPDNVLINADGLPVVLDFGLAAGPAVGQRITRTGAVLGTPMYLAPEQLASGELEVDLRADLYAVGVMLYEALAGVSPFAGESLMLRTVRRPRALHQEAPQAPRAVCEVVDRLLSPDPRDRPRSAREVIALLLGGKEAIQGGPGLPWLGSRDAIERALGALEAGRVVEVVGGRGSGRSRFIAEVSEVLEARGVEVLRAVSGERPFGSLRHVLGDGLEGAGGMAAMTAMVREALRQRHEAGAVLLIEDLERLDRWSSEAVAAVEGRGLIGVQEARGGGEVVKLQPLPVEALAGLFHGPERLFHLPSDAARELWRRTEGSPARVEDELRSWVRAGLARWEQGKLRVDRPTLERLRAGLRVGAGASSTHHDARLITPRRQELLAWLMIVWPNTSLEVISQLTGEPAWSLEGELDELCQLGLLYAEEEGRRLNPLASLRIEHSWGRERMAEAHRQVAEVLEEGVEGRLLHLVASVPLSSVSEIAAEALTQARRCDQEGQLGQAFAALTEGLLAIRSAEEPPPPSIEEALLLQWARQSLALNTSTALDRALYEMGRANQTTPTLSRVEALLSTCMEARGASAGAALRALETMEPFDDPELELWRLGFGVVAARQISIEAERRLLATIAQSPVSQHPRAATALATWTGHLHYRLGDFRQAWQHHVDAARAARRHTAHISSLLNAASALVECFELEEARALALEAHALARECRHAYYEARAEWLISACRYRLGGDEPGDPALLEAARLLGDPRQLALIALNEAASSMRAGERAEALTFLENVVDAVGVGDPMTALVVALRWHLGAPVDEAAEASFRRMLEMPLPPRTLLQAVAMARLAGVEVEPPEGLSCAHGWPSDLDVRAEVLSCREVSQALSGRG